ncbi:carboxylating nicotinate-nucleotide diphosphorylase [Neorhodopirellula pilleata]|uniref:nicotinate-nucleotide diphosphorylase (carboxylating) n=1 Tax=Neorhodopirellula pilleata TaxID=2714738 RepID=A0A5C6B0K5_9BACT|nr:carboxylating nicotinate-nucleotide diphosphorylase [Neorhodopirellula pilleata]TWU03954.1 Nicotinate-nucleotide pyrophosphorylase [carboxylating] [Neorhodopirellula pilleata]
MDELLENDLRQLVRLSIAEDLDVALDWTTVAMIDSERRGACQIVARGAGVSAGIALTPWIIDEFDADLEVEVLVGEGVRFEPGTPLVQLSGSARDLLTSERVTLNLLSRMCGVATLTRHYVDRIEGTNARLYDTRKTTPGWRRLEKYAVTCGGGHNHRTGLYDGFLIKDNHLALGRSSQSPDQPLSALEAATRAVAMRGGQVNQLLAPRMVEIEVDGLDQFEQVLETGIDIILLDNFSLEDLRAAVAARDAAGVSVELEASGNVNIDTIAAVAATGVDRISSGALTHQATWLDLGMDWVQT